MKNQLSFAQGFAYVTVIAFGLGLGAVIGFVVALATGLIRINIC